MYNVLTTEGSDKMRQQIRLDTLKDVKRFIDAVSEVEDKVTLEDGEGNCVNANSLIGVLYSFEWNSVFCSCDKDISGLILNWIV